MTIQERKTQLLSRANKIILYTIENNTPKNVVSLAKTLANIQGQIQALKWAEKGKRAKPIRR
jgi:hypothetical protein